MKSWLKEYEKNDPVKMTKLALHDAVRRYRTILLSMRCILSRVDKSITKAVYVKKFNAAVRSAQKIADC
jgi:hypothetical protein